MSGRGIDLRIIEAGGAALCFASIAVAVFYMERYLLLEPCPLCILDRIALAWTGAALAVAAAWNPRKAIRAGLCAAAALGVVAGFIFSLRHIWLQNRPYDPSAACLSDSEAARGLIEIVGRAFDANADCGAVLWEFAGLSIPEQVLILMFAVAAAVLWQGVRIGRAPR